MEIKMAKGKLFLKKIVSQFPIFLVLLELHFEGIEGLDKAESQKLLSRGNQLLNAGQLADALTQYHSAIDNDGNNYQAYYMRATVYLAMGKARSALPDLNQVVVLRPTFVQARLQRGNLFLKMGKFNEAQGDYEFVLAHEDNAAATAKVEEIRPLRRNIIKAQKLIEENENAPAIPLLNEVIESCPWNPDFRELRATAYEKLGDLRRAISDLKPTTMLRLDNTRAFLKMSILWYSLGEIDQSLDEIRECLKLDPDHRECYAHYKSVKKLFKTVEAGKKLMEESRWPDAIAKFEKALSQESRIQVLNVDLKLKICECYVKDSKTSEAIVAADAVLEIENNNIPALFFLSEAHTQEAEYEQALEDLQRAAQIDENYPGIKEKIQKAQKLLKQSQKRDYYKILGVSRNANKKDVIKAYRKLAREWHPDNFQDEEEKKRAEKRFIEIAAAKEVLSDPEKIKILHDGYDPLDPDEVAEWENEQPEESSENMFKFFFQSGGAGKTVHQKPFEDLFRSFHQGAKQPDKPSNPFHNEDPRQHQQQAEQMKQQQQQHKQYIRKEQDQHKQQQQWERSRNPHQQNTQQQQKSRSQTDRRYQSEPKQEQRSRTGDQSQAWGQQSSQHKQDRRTQQTTDGSQGQQRQFWTEGHGGKYKEKPQQRSTFSKQHEDSETFQEGKQHFGRKRTPGHDKSSRSEDSAQQSAQSSKKRKKTKKKKTKSTWSDEPTAEEKEAAHRYTKGTDGKWYYKQNDGRWRISDGPPPKAEKKKTKKTTQRSKARPEDAKQENRESSSDSYMDEKGNFFVRGSDGNWYMRVRPPPPDDDSKDQKRQHKSGRSKEEPRKAPRKEKQTRNDRPKVLPKGLFFNDRKEISDQYGNLYEIQADGRFKIVYVSEEGKSRLKRQPERREEAPREEVRQRKDENKIFRDSAGNMFLKDAHGNLIRIKSKNEGGQDQQSSGRRAENQRKNPPRHHHPVAEEEFEDNEDEEEEDYEEDEVDDRYTQKKRRQFQQGRSEQRFREQKRAAERGQFHRYQEEYHGQRTRRRTPAHEEL